MNMLVETENFYIRPIRMEDFDSSLNNWVLDKKIFKEFNYEIPKDKKEAIAMMLIWLNEYQNDDYNWHFLIQDKRDGESIGFLRTKNYKKTAGGSVEIECGLSSLYWNKGIMSECLLAFAKYLLLKCGMNRVEARCNADNKSINRVLEKCGMTLEGRCRESGQSNRYDKYDENIYSLLRKDI